MGRMKSATWMRPIVADITLSLWRLLPANPIVVRVVQGGGKRIQHLWLRASYLLVLFLVLLVMQLSVFDGRSSLSDLAKSSTQVFELIAILQLAMMCFLAPIFTAGAISQEKDAETFNVLLTTPLTNAQIALGSLASRLFFVLILLLAGLPIFCITMIFGGVTSRMIFLSFGIAGCTALLTGSLAILISVVRVGTRGTVFSFYVGIALYLFVGLALGFSSWTYVPESIVPGVSDGMTWLALIHPYWALEVALNHVRAPDAAAVADYGWPLKQMAVAPHSAYMLMTLLASGVLVALATFFVRSGVKQGEPSWWTRLRRWGRPNGRDERTRRPRRVWANPVAWREAVTRASAASSNLMRYSYLACGLAAAVLFLMAYGSGRFANVSSARDWLVSIVMIEFVIVLLMAVNTAATAITRERDDGTMELLLSTPLTSRYIVWGKLRGLISFALPLMAVPAATVLLVAVYDFLAGEPRPLVSIMSALLLAVLLAVYAALTCMLGLHMSLKSRRSVQAVLASVGILVVAAFGFGLCAYGLARNLDYIAALMTPLTFVTAIYYVLNPEDLVRSVGSSTGLAINEVKVLLSVGTLLAAGLYSAIVAGAYRSMVANFDMIVRKQSR